MASKSIVSKQKFIVVKIQFSKPEIEFRLMTKFYKNNIFMGDSIWKTHLCIKTMGFLLSQWKLLVATFFKRGFLVLLSSWGDCKQY